MQASFAFAGAIIITAIMASLSSAYARAGQPAVPNAGVITPTAPVVPPYLRDPWKSYERNPYFGRYRVEQQNFPQVPCSQTRIAFGPGGKCLQGYRLGIAPFNGWRGSSNLCDLALDVVIDTTGRLSIEADILVFDPYKVTGSGGAQPRYCYVRSYLGYDQEDFQDMNQVTRGGTNWHNLVIDEQDRQNRSIEFSEGGHSCVAVLRHGPGWEGDYVWMMHASICRTDAAPVQAQDVAYVLGRRKRGFTTRSAICEANDWTTYGQRANPSPPRR